jgi:hypothetical protein
MRAISIKRKSEGDVPELADCNATTHQLPSDVVGLVVGELQAMRVEFEGRIQRIEQHLVSSGL